MLPALQLALATYSVESFELQNETIIAMRDSYVDFQSGDESPAVGELVFALNTFELEQETFRLAQELLVSQIAASRLDPEYLEKLIYEPMNAGIELADSDVAHAQLEEYLIRRMVDAGSATILEVAEAVAQVADRKVILETVQVQLLQRQIEIDGQTRRLRAEQRDLNERILLNAKIKELAEFRMPRPGRVEYQSFTGAFVEEGDAICRIRYDEPRSQMGSRPRTIIRDAPTLISKER